MPSGLKPYRFLSTKKLRCDLEDVVRVADSQTPKNEIGQIDSNMIHICVLSKGLGIVLGIIPASGGVAQLSMSNNPMQASMHQAAGWKGTHAPRGLSRHQRRGRDIATCASAAIAGRFLSAVDMEVQKRKHILLAGSACLHPSYPHLQLLGPLGHETQILYTCAWKLRVHRLLLAALLLQ
eukprot:2928376-Amphidinium_carterae.1